MTEDIQKLILQVEGRDEVDTLRKAIEQEEEALLELIRTHGKYDPAVQASAKVVAEMTTKMNETAKAAGLTQNKLAASGQSMLQFGRIVQDFQAAGMAGIVNNFEGMASALGLGAGIAGTAQLAGVAIYALTPKIKELWAAFTAGDMNRFSGALGDVKARLEEMEKKDYKIKFDYAAIDEAKRRLDQIQKALTDFDALARQRGNIQEQVSKAVKDVIVEHAGGTDEEGGAENLRKLITEAVGGDISAADTRSGKLGQLRESLKKMRAIADSKSAATSPEQRDIAITEVARLEPQIAKIEEDIRVTTDEHIRKLVADAAAGIERARVKMLEIYDENEKVFREGVAGKAAPVAGGFRFGLEQANAAAIQQKAKDEQDLDNQKRVVKLTEAIEKKEAAEFDRAADETVRTRAEAKRVADEAADFDRSAKATFRQQMAAKAGLDKPGIASRIKAEDASIAGGAYVPRAAGEMARMQAQGGDMDRFGRFHKMTDAQIQDLVQKRVQAELQRNNPGMGAEQRGDVATKITSLATTDLQKRMTAMNAGGLNNTARLIAITAQLTSEVQKQVLVGQAQARAIDQVSRQAAGIGQTRQNFRNR